MERKGDAAATAGAKFSLSHRHSGNANANIGQQSRHSLGLKDVRTAWPSLFSYKLNAAKLVSIIFYRVLLHRNCKLIIAMRHLLAAVDTN